MLCACAAARGQPIVVGQIGPFTVLPSPDATEINQAAQAYFDQVNEGGGIGGRKISFFKLDDKFNGDEFAAQLEVAQSKKPIALITPIGSAALQKAIKENLFDKHDFVIVNAIPGAETFRKPGHPRLFHVRASDGDQIAKIVQHVRSLGVGNMQVLHQDLPIGTAGLAFAQQSGKAAGLAVEGVQAKHDDAAIGEAARKVAAKQPDSTLVIGSPKFMADAVVSLRKAGISSSVFALSYLPPALLLKVAGEEGARGVAITQAFPNPNGRVLALQRDFQATMKKFAPAVTAYNTFHLEGYLSARVLVEALRRGGPSTPEQLAKNLRAMGPIDFGGFTVNFSNGNAGSGFVDIGIVTTGGKLLY